MIDVILNVIIAGLTIFGGWFTYECIKRKELTRTLWAGGITSAIALIPAFFGYSGGFILLVLAAIVIYVKYLIDR